MKIILLIFFLLNVVSITLGQGSTPNSPREAELRAAEKKAMGKDEVYERHKAIVGRQNENGKQNEALETNVNRQFIPKNRTKLTKEEKEEIEKREKEFNALRSPHSEDLKKYDYILKQKNTGIFKLFPDLPLCRLGGVLRVSNECADAVFDSWFYSFSKRNYVDTELKLENTSLISDSFLSQNILVNLGDIELENVSLNLDQAKFLVDFQPEKESKKAKEQFWQISKKLKINGATYGKVTKVVVNSTFLIRIIGYQLGNKTKTRLQNMMSKTIMEQSLEYLDADKTRSDKIIAFKIIREDYDGSITIVWKELFNQKSPSLEFEEDEKLTDLKNQ